MMDIDFKICKLSNHQMRIESDTDSYIDESESERFLSGLYSKGKFKYSQTATLTIMSYNSVLTESVSNYKIEEHCDYLDEVVFDIAKDGWYTITQLIIPTKEWFDLELTDKNNIYVNNPDVEVYYTDLENVYHYHNGVSTTVDFLALKDINLQNTTLSRLSKDFFYKKYLKNCYLFYCKSILNKEILKCMENNISLKDFIWKRDFVWMALNAIKFYLEDNLYAEALRILQLVNYCGGLCSKTETSKKLQDCGCSKN